MKIMKPDIEAAYCNWLAKPFEYTNSFDDSAAMKENQNGNLDHLNGHAKKESDSVPAIRAYTELRKDSDLYTYRNFECDLLDKDGIWHAAKDICTDEVLLSGRFTDGRFYVPSNGFSKYITKEVINTNFPSQDGLRRSLSCKDCNGDDTCDRVNERKAGFDLLVIPDGQKSSAEDDIYQDAADDCGAVGQISSSESDKDRDSASLGGSEDWIQSSVAKSNAAHKTKDSDSNNRSVVKEYQSLRSLFEASSRWCDKDIGQQSKQIHCVQEISKDPELSIPGASNKSTSVDNLIYNRKVEGGIITFNFDYSKALVITTRDDSPENVIEKLPKSEEKQPVHNDGVSVDLVAASRQVRRDEMGEASFSSGGPLVYRRSVSHQFESGTTSNVIEQVLTSEERPIDSDGISAKFLDEMEEASFSVGGRLPYCGSISHRFESGGNSDVIEEEEKHVHDDGISLKLVSASRQVKRDEMRGESFSIGGPGSVSHRFESSTSSNVIGQLFKTEEEKPVHDDDGISVNLVAAGRQVRRDEMGEASFTVEGHEPYCGSVSQRSDSSTTSAKSFAFPILRNEWNGSPARMAGADPRHKQKHRRWMSFFCF